MLLESEAACSKKPVKSHFTPAHMLCFSWKGPFTLGGQSLHPSLKEATILLQCAATFQVLLELCLLTTLK